LNGARLLCVVSGVLGGVAGIEKTEKVVISIRLGWEFILLQIKWFKPQIASKPAAANSL